MTKSMVRLEAVCASFPLITAAYWRKRGLIAHDERPIKGGDAPVVGRGPDRLA